MIRPESSPTPCSTTITITAAALLGLGVVMVFSAGATLASPETRAATPALGSVPAISKDPAVRQAMFSFAALVSMLMVGLCPYQSWKMRSRRPASKGWRWQPALALSLLALSLLALVLVPGIGEQRNGARRWLPLGPAALGLGFQPSEIAKVAIVIFLAACSAHWGKRLRRFWTGFLPLMLVLGLFAGLVGIEDFGTGVLLAVVGGCILLGAGARIWHLILASLPAIGGLVYLISMKPYRLLRLTSFLNPQADPQGTGYHQIQSLVTIASGGWWGQGLGAGVQKYGYLPEARTDFIFAVICEELGIIGGIAVIALFGILLWQGRRAMQAAPGEFGRLLALGASLTIGLQAAMNVGVVTVSIPAKGIGLPLVSAGGTGVIFFGILIGLLVNVARHHAQRERATRTFPRPTRRPAGAPAATQIDEPGVLRPHRPAPDTRPAPMPTPSIEPA